MDANLTLHIMMEPNELQIGNYVIINYGNQYKDVFKVVQLNAIRKTATLLRLPYTGENPIQVSNDNDEWKMMNAIPFDESFFEYLGFIGDTTYEILGVLGQGGYVFWRSNNDDVIVRYENNNWALFYKENADEEKFVRRRFLYLHEFQNIVSEKWSMDYSRLEEYLIKRLQKQNPNETTHP